MQCFGEMEERLNGSIPEAGSARMARFDERTLVSLLLSVLVDLLFLCSVHLWLTFISHFPCLKVIFIVSA